MVGNMSMSSIESVLAAVATKYGWLKLFTLTAALGGAVTMAVFRPPKTKKEMLRYAFVAIACSLLFGDTAAHIINNWLHLVDLVNVKDGALNFYVSVHALVGSLSWGFVGALTHWRDKLQNNPQGAINDAKDLVQ